MPESLDEDAERKIIEEGGMSVDSFRKIIDTYDQKSMDMSSFRTIAMMVNNEPSEVEHAKAIKIRETIELEKNKKAEQATVEKAYIRWVIIYDKAAACRRYMELEVDEGANANFLTQGMATDRRLKVQSLEAGPFSGQTINGDVVCYEYAKVTLFGGSHDEQHHIEAVFYILPANAPPNDPRIDKPVVGRHFLQEAGHLLLTEDPRDPVWTTKMGKESKDSKEQREQRRADVKAHQANTSRNRDASRRNKDDRDKKAQDKGISSRSEENRGN